MHRRWLVATCPGHLLHHLPHELHGSGRREVMFRTYLDVHWKHWVPRSLPDMSKSCTACEHLDKPSPAPRQSPRHWGGPFNTTDTTGRGALPPTASGGRSSSLKASTGGGAQPPEARRMGGVGSMLAASTALPLSRRARLSSSVGCGHSHQLPRHPTCSRSASKRFCAWLTQTARGRVGYYCHDRAVAGPRHRLTHISWH